MAQEEVQAEAGASEEIEQGAYDLLKSRLEGQAIELKKKVDALNAKRAELFGGRELTVLGTERIRTENNCVPVDIISVGDLLLLGYNVELVRAEKTVGDLFALHRFEAQEGTFGFPPLAKDDARNFLQDAKFQAEFGELVKYNKMLNVRMLRQQGTAIQARLQTGENKSDRKVLEWVTTRDRGVVYSGDKGEIVYPNSHDFKWRETTRKDHTSGTHPHVNIANKVFVECVGGDLTVKIEDNSEDGMGVYREPVEQPNQALHDAQIHYHDAEELILLKILPYREKLWRYLVYNTRNKSVTRIDQIGNSCVMLPENHGIVFPGGYYLLEGSLKLFEGSFEGLVLARPPLASPNGEDVLYVFRNPETTETVILSYNLVSREMSTPIRCHGFSIFDDGTTVIFRSDENQEPSKVHPLQIWQTPFMTAENYELAPRSGAYLEKIGNAELVRGVSDTLSVARRIREQKPSTITYNDLIRSVTKALDTHHWLNHEEVGEIDGILKEIRSTAELVLQEFDKVEKLRKQAKKDAEDIEAELAKQRRTWRHEDWTELDPFVASLDSLRSMRGKIITVAEQKYALTEQLQKNEKEVVEKFDEISGAAVKFLIENDAFAPYRERITVVEQQVAQVQKASEVTPLAEELADVARGLEILQEIVATLQVDDPTLRTQILEQISEVTSLLNRVRAQVVNARKSYGEKESMAEFSVQFKLFSQNVQSALSLADTPEKVDESLSSLLLSLEELEAKFGEFDIFLEDLYQKREEIMSSFGSKKQLLSDQRQRKVDQLLSAADRVLEGIVRRATTLQDNEKLNTFFASDPMVMKVRDLADKLRAHNSDVKAEELLARLKVARQDSARGLRDRQELFEGGDNLVKLGRHRFNVNTEPMGLSLVPRDGAMAFHVTGTDFFEKVEDETFAHTKEFWDQEFVSENKEVYRSEYLAFCLLDDVRQNKHPDLDLRNLMKAHLEGDNRLLEIVREYSAERYDEGYDRGVHDEDAVKILHSLLGVYKAAGWLRYTARARSAAILTWTFGVHPKGKDVWLNQARSLTLLKTVFSGAGDSDAFEAEVAQKILEFCNSKGFELPEPLARQSAEYLIAELGERELRFVTSGDAARIKSGFTAHLQKGGHEEVFLAHLEALKGQIERQYDLCLTWIRSFVESLGRGKDKTLARAMLVQEEAAVMLMTDGLVDRELSSAATVVKIEGLLGQHPGLKEGVLEIRLDEFLSRLETFRYLQVPAFREYQKARLALMEKERHRLRLDEYTPKVMSAFVRNKLINEVYLPLIGDNLAKQMGSAGADKRTDQMGLLLLISPPGYGKTTLMEYVASRLGLIFVKVNGPALGHSVTSLDPNEADNATSAQEVEKVNFGLEMGNNVMLYLDDIQHCDPEFLQKFISLCDGQRRIEGVWKGRTRTYDMKGKRFCIIMAGNPYTETGSKFQIPDMLANRADTYNLGDILSGKQQVFEMSYIENSLTSNPTLSPLAARDQEDLYKFIQIADGTPIPISEMKHNYAAAEADEIVTVLKKLMKIQETVLMVNQEYINSASKDDKYRTEPPFKLQGSYRNMNKMAEKVVPVMNEKELESLIADHYVGESQTLTTGAEQNLLKLAELRGSLSETQAARWSEIKKDFTRNKIMGGDENDPVMKMTSVLAVLGEKLEEIQGSILKAGENSRVEITAPTPQASANGPEFAKYLQGLQDAITRLADRPAPTVTVQAEIPPGALAAAAPPAASAPAAPEPAPAPSMPPPAPTMPPPHQAIEPVGPAPSAALSELGSKVVPALRQVAEMIRGPHSKTILLDGKLVDAFDALRDAQDLDDVMRALSPLRRNAPKVT